MIALRKCKVCGLEAHNESDLELFNIQPKGKYGRKELCKQCKSKAHDPKKKKNADLKRLYGITLNEYDDLLKEQGYMCACCGTDNPRGKGRFVVDHCHTTGEVRGLLCSKCNIGIGQFDDDTSKLMSAINYLKRTV